ncbi:hypothetical protein L9F63_022685, partial [Diploptera punctata]
TQKFRFMDCAYSFLMLFMFYLIAISKFDFFHSSLSEFFHPFYIKHILEERSSHHPVAPGSVEQD